MKAHCIIPRVLYQRSEFAHVASLELQADLSAWGVGVVVGVAGRKCTVLEGLPGITYLYEYIPDGVTVDREKVCGLALKAARLMQERKCGALTHCHAGRNRSGLISALIAVAMCGLSGTEAIDLVRRGRPRALANPTFENFLNNILGFDTVNQQYIFQATYNL